MARLEASVSVSKQSYQLAQCLAEIVDVVKQSLADGWQPGMDIPMIITQVIGKLGSGLQGIDKIQEEFKAQDAAATAMAFLIPIMKVVDQFLQEIPAQEEAK